MVQSTKFDSITAQFRKVGKKGGELGYKEIEGAKEHLFLQKPHMCKKHP